MAHSLMLKHESLKNALASVATIIKSKTPKPIIQNALIQFSQDSVRIIGTDLVTYLQADVEFELVRGGSGEILISASLLSAILAENEGDTVLIKTGKDWSAEISIGAAEYIIPLPEAAEFPKWPDGKFPASFQIPVAAMKTGIRLTSFAVEKEGFTPSARSGVLLDLEREEYLSFVATDQRRISAYEVKLPAKVSGMVGKPVLSKESCKGIDRLFKDGPEEMLTVKVSGSAVLIEGKGTKFFCSLLEGRFPDWKRVVPASKKDCSVEVTANAFLSGVKLAGITTTNESKGIDLMVRNNSMLITSDAKDLGSSRTELIVSHPEGFERKFRLDSKFLGDFLSVVPPEGMVRLLVVDPVEPVMLSHGDSQRYILSPMEQR